LAVETSDVAGLMGSPPVRPAPPGDWTDGGGGGENRKGNLPCHSGENQTFPPRVTRKGCKKRRKKKK